MRKQKWVPFYALLLLCVFVVVIFFMLLILWTAISGHIVYCDVVNVQPCFNFSDEMIK